jgi:hypothetical protein
MAGTSFLTIKVSELPGCKKGHKAEKVFVALWYFFVFTWLQKLCDFRWKITPPISDVKNYFDRGIMRCGPYFFPAQGNQKGHQRARYGKK